MHDRDSFITKRIQQRRIIATPHARILGLSERRKSRGWLEIPKYNMRQHVWFAMHRLHSRMLVFCLHDIKHNVLFIGISGLGILGHLIIILIIILVFINLHIR